MKYRIVKRQYGMYWYWNRSTAAWGLDRDRASIYGAREHDRVVSLGDDAFWQVVAGNVPAGI